MHASSKEITKKPEHGIHGEIATPCLYPQLFDISGNVLRLGFNDCGHILEIVKDFHNVYPDDNEDDEKYAYEYGRDRKENVSVNQGLHGYSYDDREEIALRHLCHHIFDF
jgi:hypothetical protein